MVVIVRAAHKTLIGHWRSNEQFTRDELNKCNKCSEFKTGKPSSLVKQGEPGFIFTRLFY